MRFSGIISSRMGIFRGSSDYTVGEEGDIVKGMMLAPTGKKFIRGFGGRQEIRSIKVACIVTMWQQSL